MHNQNQFNESIPDLLTEYGDYIKIRTFVGEGLCNAVKEETPFPPYVRSLQLTQLYQCLFIPQTGHHILKNWLLNSCISTVLRQLQCLVNCSHSHHMLIIPCSKDNTWGPIGTTIIIHATPPKLQHLSS